MENGESTCIFCLEECTEKKPSLLSCSCSFFSHSGCYATFITMKKQTECPICHLVIQETPEERRTRHQEERRGRRERRQQQREQRQQREDDSLREARQCTALCMGILLLWCLALIIGRVF